MSAISTADSAQDAQNQISLLDRRPWLPIVLLILLPLVLQFPFFLFHLSTDPVWYYSGVTQSSHLPGSPVLDPNGGWTSDAMGHLAAWDWAHGIVPWWNPFSGIGMPLAGELQPGAFFLPFTLLLMLPEGLLWQKIVMQIIAGLATYALLRELGLSRLAAFTGGALFALNGTITWTPGPASVYCSLPFLPLLLFGIERARKPAQGAVSILAMGLAIAWSVLAGFPEVAYINGLLALCWGIYRLVDAPHRWNMAARALTGWVIGMLVAAPLLIAFFDDLRQSDAFSAHATSGASQPWPALATFFMPYVYGPLGTNLGSDTLRWVWGSIGGFTSILVLLIAICGLTRRSAHRGLKLLLLAWVALTWARSFGIQPVTLILDHLPLLGHAVFYRYAPPSWEFALIVLAAFGLDEFRHRTLPRRAAFGITLLLLSIGAALAWPLHRFWGWSHAQALVMLGFWAVALLWAIAGLFAIWLVWGRMRAEQRRVALACIFIIDAAGMFTVAKLSAARHGKVDTQALDFLHSHLNLSRFYSLGPLQPNYGAYFQIASINHNVFPVPKLWLNYADHNLLPGLEKGTNGAIFHVPSWAGYDYEAATQTFSRNLSYFQEVGVRYLLTNPSQNPLPTIYLPQSEAGRSRTGPGDNPAQPSKKVVKVLQWCHSVMHDPRKPAIEHFFAKKIAQSLDHYGTARSNAGSAEGMSIPSGRTIELHMSAPSSPAGDSSIEAVGVAINSHTTSGFLAVKVCNANLCQSGQRSLSESGDDSFFDVELDQSIAAPSPSQLTLFFTYSGGTAPLALQLDPAGKGQQLDGPAGAPVTGALQLALEYAVGEPAMHKVYADSLMDIWEVPKPAPYFQVLQGGPCTLTSGSRDAVTADCAAPATLLRRELYMPGWQVSGNGNATLEQAGIFQSATLPAGRSQLRFRFEPPHMKAGWMAFWAGIAALLWQLLRILRGPRMRDDQSVERVRAL